MLGVQELQLCSPTDGTTNMCSAGKQLKALITQVGKLHRSWGKGWEESQSNNKKVSRNRKQKRNLANHLHGRHNLFVINLNCECTVVAWSNNTEAHNVPSECQMWTINHLILMSFPYLTTLCIHFLHCSFPTHFPSKHGSCLKCFTTYQLLNSLTVVGLQ